MLSLLLAPLRRLTLHILVPAPARVPVAVRLHNTTIKSLNISGAVIYYRCSEPFRTLFTTCRVSLVPVHLAELSMSCMAPPTTVAVLHQPWQIMLMYCAHVGSNLRWSDGFEYLVDSTRTTSMYWHSRDYQCSCLMLCPCVCNLLRYKLSGKPNSLTTLSTRSSIHVDMPLSSSHTPKPVHASMPLDLASARRRALFGELWLGLSHYRETWHAMYCNTTHAMGRMNLAQNIMIQSGIRRIAKS